MGYRVEIKAELYAWARERSGRGLKDLTGRFPKLSEWESGEARPTLNQLKNYAKATYTPIGYFFLPEPPDEKLPIPDFRTVAGGGADRPSADLLDTIYMCQQRQDWYRGYALSNGLDEVGLVGSSDVDTSSEEAAARIEEALGRVTEKQAASESEKFRQLVEGSEQAGVLVMVSGVVGNNNHRKLDPEEFRGFSLVDDFAPVVFVNGADTKRAQIFTLAHELVHITTRRTGLDRADLGVRIGDRVERWCNEVAAELLVPMVSLQETYDPHAGLTYELQKLARRFRVSTLVILHRLHDAGYLDWDTFREEYQSEQTCALNMTDKSGDKGGGNFYHTTTARASKTFMHAIINSTIAGETLYRDAFQMLQIKKHKTFDNLATHIGVL